MDPNTLNILATGVVATITPYLARAAEEILPKAAEDLYAALKNRLSQRPAAEEALNDLEKKPGDPDAQAALRQQLKKLLSEDDDFVAELQDLLERAEQPNQKTSVSAASRGVAAGGDVRGNVITGDVGGSVSISNHDTNTS